jgi:primosomal protein N' (replication factor Y)
LVNIGVPGTPRRLFTYRVASEASRHLQAGQRLIVPLGRRKVVGYFIEPARQKPDVPIKNILGILDSRSVFNAELFAFLKWMSEYYYANIADVLNASLPPCMRKIAKPSYIPAGSFESEAGKNGLPEKMIAKIKAQGVITPRDAHLIEGKFPGAISAMEAAGAITPTYVDGKTMPSGILLGYTLPDSISADDKWVARLMEAEPKTGLIQKKEIMALGISEYRFRKLVEQHMLRPAYGLPDIFDYIRPRTEVDRISPNEEQEIAIRFINDKLGRFAPILLYGITGSGKTLVYCHTAKEVLKQGKTALVLVPEIALAGTLLSYFKSFFEDGIVLLHSGLKPRERLLIWQNIRNGKYRIVIGARSAIFAPLENLGLIIVDEEHDESYKQDDPSPRFHARDAAVMRAKMAGVPVVLGSASPSVESFHNAESGRYELIKLTRRPEKAEIPLVRLVDLKEEWSGPDQLFFTKTMKSHVTEALDGGNQVILYLNRRGFSPRIKCTDCGHTPSCPHCNISLTYHKAGQRLMCHFCGYVKTGYDTCANCGGDKFVYLGTGTQKIEDKIGELFEDARLVRLDSDTAAGRERAHLILSDFAAGKFNILLGTQMVSKGIDFPNVALVGVLMADIGLDMPDFRASEKLFAKLIQVAGRSGRGIIPGEVIIQTFNPELELIDDAARQDYDTFYAREILSRKQLAYPPFSHLVNFRFSAKKEETVQKHSLEFKAGLESRLKDSDLSVHILGPAPCPLYRLRGLYRRHLFVKTRQILKFIKLLDRWEGAQPGFALPSAVRLTVDVDPYDMM